MAFSGATPNSCGNRPANGNREFKALSNLVLNKQINKYMQRPTPRDRRFLQQFCVIIYNEST